MTIFAILTLILEKPEEIVLLNSIRLYTKDEIENIFKERNMEIIKNDLTNKKKVFINN